MDILARKKEALALLPASGIKKIDFTQIDREIKEMHEWLCGEIRERSNFLAEEKRRQENIPYTDWQLKIRSPLEPLRLRMVAVNNYIYRHATQFSCFTSQAAKMKAKEEALQAYRIIKQVIEDPTYTIDQQHIDLFKIHNNNLRNAIILIVAGAVLLALALAVCLACPFVMSAIAGGSAASLAWSETAIIMATIFTALTSSLVVVGGVGLIVQGWEKIIENSQDKIFRNSFSKTLPDFFHQDVKTLLPNKTDSASPSATVPLVSGLDKGPK